jgi:hypothetical protein
MPADPNMTVLWKVFTDAGNEQGAARIFKRVLGILGGEISDSHLQPYPKGGFVISFCSSTSATSWPEAVVEVLGSAQRVGHGWLLSGNIAEELDACCNKPRVAGITFIHVTCQHVSRA